MNHCEDSKYHGDCDCDISICPDCEEEMYWSKAPWQENAIYECYECDYIKEII